MKRLARSDFARTRWGRLGDRLFARGPARRSVEAAVLTCLWLPAEQRDTALADLLRRAIAAVVRKDSSPYEANVDSQQTDPLTPALLG